MSIGILYESDEWSNIQLQQHLQDFGILTENIFIEELTVNLDRLPKHKLYLNRVFPSAGLRNHIHSLNLTLNFLKILQDTKIPFINSMDAFLYDCNKKKWYYKLIRHDFPVQSTKHINPNRIVEKQVNHITFPAVLKPNCSGRSWNVRFVKNKQDLSDALIDISGDSWLLQEFIPAEKGYTTRVEIIGKKTMTVLKRFLGNRGISSYSEGSSYELYPDCPAEVIEMSLEIMDILNIEMGSLDIIEKENGDFFVIDVNATSNFTPDYIPLLGFDPIKKMAEYILSEYNES